MSDRQTIVLVDDEPAILRSEGIVLRRSGFGPVVLIDDPRQVMERIAQGDVVAVVLDLNMPHISGATLLESIASEFPQVSVIVATARDDVGTAVDCMRHGAFDYLVKPIDQDRLVSALEHALEMRELRQQLSQVSETLLSGELHNPQAFASLVTEDEGMLAIFRYVEAIAPSSQSVLISGETGTGKELLARAIHDVSGRSGAFVAENVAGLDDDMLSDTLFGHVRGAFTSADSKREGLVAKAAGGTLFLDEIGDLSMASQVKLLRLLQERRYYPLGSDTQARSEARIVVASNRDLESDVEQGRFRNDLFFRLRTHRIHLPPLRERSGDLPPLVAHFIRAAAADLGKPAPTPPDALFAMLAGYDFPGNVRELEALIFDAVAVHSSGPLQTSAIAELAGYTSSDVALLSNTANVRTDLPLPTLEEAEISLIRTALARADGNQRLAAGMLGLTRQALNKRIIRARKAGKDV